ncbi:MAG: hypothetical protein A3K65_04515 [Euryarchaeota archaeon RBG_16_68_12]|nr:MAG: hypothetical protein A3K65_04515 [Euryarchaeota archaeon RBG_16_68_12]
MKLIAPSSRASRAIVSSSMSTPAFGRPASILRVFHASRPSGTAPAAVRARHTSSRESVHDRNWTPGSPRYAVRVARRERLRSTATVRNWPGSGTSTPPRILLARATADGPWTARWATNGSSSITTSSLIRCFRMWSRRRPESSGTRSRTNASPRAYTHTSPTTFPFGFRTRAYVQRPGPRVARSWVTSPFRKETRSGPDTRTFVRSEWSITPATVRAAATSASRLE